MADAWRYGPALVSAGLLSSMACTLQGCLLGGPICEPLTLVHGGSEAAVANSDVTPTCEEGFEYRGPELSCNWVGKTCKGKDGEPTDKCTNMYGIGEKGTGLKKWPAEALPLLGDPCDCFPSWTYLGVDYKGCSDTPDWPYHKWCYVVGGATCEYAEKSANPSDPRLFRECDACGCQTKWKYWGLKGKAGGGTEHTYYGCDVTPDWKGHKWCYVNGWYECWTAHLSNVPGEKRKYKECDPCDCEGTWNYKGVEYLGCSETPDWPFHKWCYVADSEKCLMAEKSLVNGESRKFIECTDPCTCAATWDYQGKDYEGCSATPDWPGHTWCYVTGGLGCKDAKDSALKGEKRKFAECDACACLGTWKYHGPKGKDPEKRYAGCAETPDWKGHTWCYVNAPRGDACKEAKPSMVPGEKRKFRECKAPVPMPEKVPMADLVSTCVLKDGPKGDFAAETGDCACMTTWKYEGQNKTGCAETPDWKGHWWCYVNGGAKCTTAKVSKHKKEKRKYLECSPCACMGSWQYSSDPTKKEQTKTYLGCAETPDWKGQRWCYVTGGDKCPTAKKSIREDEERKWTACAVPISTSKYSVVDAPKGLEPGYGMVCLLALAGVAAACGAAALVVMRMRRGRILSSSLTQESDEDRLLE